LKLNGKEIQSVLTGNVKITLLYTT
jgi:hypothetical protein